MNALKFPALAIGQRFTLRGTLYVKTSPLLARAEISGQSQMIPRSAQVAALDAAPPQQSAARSVPHVVNDLHAAARMCLETLAKASATPPKVLMHARKQLDVALRQALAQLDKNN